MTPIRFKLLANGILPTLGSEQAAGWDLYAIKDAIMAPGETYAAPLGLSMEIPPPLFGQIVPRSSVSMKGALIHTGTIDPDYRGELRVIVSCLTPRGFTIKAGDRIAQLIFHRVEPVALFVADELSETKRGSGGFGSTGR